MNISNSYKDQKNNDYQIFPEKKLYNSSQKIQYLAIRITPSKKSKLVIAEEIKLPLDKSNSLKNDINTILTTYKQIKHPNLMKIYHFSFINNEILYIFYKYYHEGTISIHLYDFPNTMIQSFIIQIIDAFSYLMKKIDFKKFGSFSELQISNIILNINNIFVEDFQIKVNFLNFTQEFDDKMKIFNAPELFSKIPKIKTENNILFSLGIVVYFMYFKKVPWEIDENELYLKGYKDYFKEKLKFINNKLILEEKENNIPDSACEFILGLLKLKSKERFNIKKISEFANCIFLEENNWKSIVFNDFFKNLTNFHERTKINDIECNMDIIFNKFIEEKEGNELKIRKYFFKNYDFEFNKLKLNENLRTIQEKQQIPKKIYQNLCFLLKIGEFAHKTIGHLMNSKDIFQSEKKLWINLCFLMSKMSILQIEVIKENLPKLKNIFLFEEKEYDLFKNSAYYTIFYDELERNRNIIHENHTNLCIKLKNMIIFQEDNEKVFELLDNKNDENYTFVLDDILFEFFDKFSKIDDDWNKFNKDFLISCDNLIIISSIKNMFHDIYEFEAYEEYREINFDDIKTGLAGRIDITLKNFIKNNN